MPALLWLHAAVRGCVAPAAGKAPAAAWWRAVRGGAAPLRATPPRVLGVLQQLLEARVFIDAHFGNAGFWGAVNRRHLDAEAARALPPALLDAIGRAYDQAPRPFINTACERPYQSYFNQI